ncbi:DUF4136 domain-containing protein [Robbsia sp. Bb-Pol-6]|uniref:DUF4136 domain-containing protein n=1 Tax=Robbsia betulipollinis TaxID=2981849 RepID=A0ABT3ZQ44_9BURK|nr:DUF4136 domain-containing protein [Robbsia betulipollinis]MCY0388660.1 DUF4136 domain-containing protein [Robbsia betulipollinis]
MTIERCRGRLLAVVTIALSGCANYLSANVTAFQDWQGSDRDRTYTFERTPAQENDLEQAAYEGLVDRELSTYGFRRVAPPPEQTGAKGGAGGTGGTGAAAHYGVSLTYGQRDTVAYAPQFLDYGGWGFGGPWGGGRGAWAGRGGAFGAGWGTAPIVDVPYAASASQLTLRIRERPSGREVYKVSVRYDGERTALPVVMPYLVRGALFDFPMPNGTSREVRIPLGKRHASATNEVALPASGPAR